MGSRYRCDIAHPKASRQAIYHIVYVIGETGDVGAEPLTGPVKAR